MNAYPSIQDFRRITADFASGELPAGDFEAAFLELFRNHEALFPETSEAALNTFFPFVEAFCSDPALFDEDDVSEVELRDAAQAFLAATA